MKKRNILFGYQYQNGVITIHPQEVAVIKRIFSEYQNGMSLLEIDSHLNDGKIEYQPGVTGWNKSRIMRLIEDERYTGKNGFPAVIDEETHQAMVEMKANKNTQSATDRSAEVFHIDVPVICQCAVPIWAVGTTAGSKNASSGGYALMPSAVQ